jgi:hypothetical protein
VQKKLSFRLTSNFFFFEIFPYEMTVDCVNPEGLNMRKKLQVFREMEIPKNISQYILIFPGIS